MTTLLTYWQSLVEAWGFAAAALVLIYAGLLIVLALLLSAGRLSSRRLRRAWRTRRVARELRLIHDQAYRERPTRRGPHAA
jgi:hypothetical protein